MKTYFISDIHFGGEDEIKEVAKRAVLKDFLESVLKDSNQLFIIGDLFDFWFEYKNVIQSEHFEVLSMLKNAMDKGLQITYIAGNHDFWVGNFLSSTLGIKVYLDPTHIQFDGKTFFFSHGDGVAKNDRGYRLMKRVFRFKPNIFLYRWLHPDIGVPLAKFVSGSSRKYSSSIDLKDHDDYLEYAEKYLNEGADFVLMGHRHNPLKHQFSENKTYINTGDWIHHFTYAVYENGSIDLFNLKERYTSIYNERNKK